LTKNRLTKPNSYEIAKTKICKQSAKKLNSWTNKTLDMSLTPYSVVRPLLHQNTKRYTMKLNCFHWRQWQIQPPSLGRSFGGGYFLENSVCIPTWTKCIPIISSYNHYNPTN